MMEKLEQNFDELNDEEKFMNEKYLKLKEWIDFLDAYPD